MGWTVYNSDGQILQGSSTLADDSVTSAKIVNGAIVAADINASAAIEFSQMENLTPARALVTDGNGDILVSGVTTTELELLDGLTSSTAELNILDGVTSNATELNLLDNVSGLVQADLTKLAAIDSTAAEVNLLNGVSGLVQADLTKLAAIDATAAEIDLLDGVSGLVQADFTKLAAIDASAAELNKLDGADGNVTATNLNALTGSGATALHSHSGGGGAVTRAGGNLDGTGTYQNAGNTEATTTSTSAVDVLATTSLSIGTSTGFDAVLATRKTSGATAGFGAGVKINSTITHEAHASGGHVFLPTNHQTNAAENRWGHLDSGIRLSNYAHGLNSFGGGFTDGAQSAGGRPSAQADMPVATITSIIVRGYINTSGITGGVDEMHVYTRAIS